MKKNGMPKQSKGKHPEKLKRAQKCSILGPQKLGSREGWAPGPLGYPGSASGNWLPKK